MALMKSIFVCAALTGALLALPTLVLTQAPAAGEVSARAKQVHERAIVIDSPRFIGRCTSVLNAEPARPMNMSTIPKWTT